MVTVIAVAVAFLAGAVLATLFHSGLRARYAQAQTKLRALEIALAADIGAMPDKAREKLREIVGR